MNLQKTYEVWDTITYDDGTNTNWLGGANLTKTTDNNVVTLKTSNANSTTGKIRLSNELTGDFEAYLTAKLNQASNNNYAIYIGFMNGTNLSDMKLTSNEWLYVKIRRENGVYSCSYSTDNSTWVTGTMTYTNAGTGTVNFFIMVYNTSGTEYSMSYKDLKIYQI